MSNIIFPDGSDPGNIKNHLMINHHRLMWVAYYRNGKIITQYAENSAPRTVEDIPRLNLKRISLIDHNGIMRCSQDFLPGQTPLFRSRTALVTGKGIADRVYILGWVAWEECKVSKMNVAFVNESDFSVEMGHFVSGPSAGVKYPIELHEIDYKPIEWT
jgi:hypothetical protein